MPLLFAAVIFASTLALPACSGSPSNASTPTTNNDGTQGNGAASTKPRAGRIEELPSQGGTARSYVVAPSTPGKHPAIVVIQEWWGLNDWIMDDADRFASQGYVASAVDLYRGKVASSPDVAHELMRGLDEARGLADLEAALAALKKRPDVDAQHIGAIGWCMGGGYALSFASTEPSLAAVVMNYGHLLTKDDAIAAIKAPLLGNFAENDQGIPPADVNAFAAKLKQENKEVDFKVFPGVGHAFMNPNNTKGYNEAAAKDAWARTDAFFAAKLKGVK